MTKRGCGERVQGGLYISVPSGYYGMSIEHFLVDPPVRWDGGQVRAPMLIPQDGVNHVLLGIGREFYPFVPDFVEEARVMGISKRIPFTFDLTTLKPPTDDTPASGLLLVHPRAIAKPTFFVEPQWYGCLWSKCFMRSPDVDVPCGYHHQLAAEHLASRPVMPDDVTTGFPAEDLGALWPLSVTQSSPTHRVTPKGPYLDRGDAYEIETPSVEYLTWGPPHVDNNTHDGGLPRLRVDYAAGVIFRFPSFFLEFVHADGSMPGALETRAKESGWDINVAAE